MNQRAEDCCEEELRHFNLITHAETWDGKSLLTIKSQVRNSKEDFDLVRFFFFGWPTLCVDILNMILKENENENRVHNMRIIPISYEN